MKLSLDELEVESYALQVSESELSDVKGGTTWWCVFDAAVAVIGTAGSIWAAFQSSGSSTGTSSGNGSDMAGSFEWVADSVKIIKPDGTVIILYNPKGSGYGSY